jgi:hypothetical protein
VKESVNDDSSDSDTADDNDNYSGDDISAIPLVNYILTTTTTSAEYNKSKSHQQKKIKKLKLNEPIRTAASSMLI